jgi:hypothetical protein
MHCSAVVHGKMRALCVRVSMVGALVVGLWGLSQGFFSSRRSRNEKQKQGQEQDWRDLRLVGTRWHLCWNLTRSGIGTS